MLYVERDFDTEPPELPEGCVSILPDEPGMPCLKLVRNYFPPQSSGFCRDVWRYTWEDGDDVGEQFIRGDLTPYEAAEIVLREYFPTLRL
ncbi:hypothetical protein FZ103_03485 [Streptomonospora sp. PA3]|uniref:hypothetical protein n=1 Tax=Streptomonospora sp. PA3 TaxID=2607326 RepID=UPI0012DFC379|nr:hypothetical protein [Streptomonospora sp. PA3]MUL40249.1 hypothetical protein [Streptomonospora sp. PA3]